MPTTRAQAVTRVRRKLRDFYRDTDAINMSVSGFISTATALTADSGTKFARGDHLQIEDEVLDVVSVSANTVNVRRGALATTAANHADNIVVYLASPGNYTDHEIEQAMSDTERYMFPSLTEEYVGSTRGTAMLMINDADATTGWSAMGEVTGPTANTADPAEGTGALDYAFVYSSSGSGSLALTATAFNTRPYSYLNGFVYVSDLEDSTGANTVAKDWAFDVRIGTSATVYKSHRISTKELATSWNLISIAIPDMLDTTTAPAVSAMTRLELKTFADQSITSGDLRTDAWFLTTYPVVKSGYQRYTNPKNVINVRQIEIDGRPIINFKADQNSFALNTDTETVTTYSVGDAIIVLGQKMPEPMTDTMDLDVRNEVMELFDLYTAQQMVEMKLVPRTNFESFSGRRNVADITSAEIITTQNQIMRRIKDLEVKLNMPGRGILL